MRKTHKRARRGPSFGWWVAHARLEDRLLLSGTAVEMSSQGRVAAASGVTNGVFEVLIASSFSFQGFSPQPQTIVDPGEGDLSLSSPSFSFAPPDTLSEPVTAPAAVPSPVDVLLQGTTAAVAVPSPVDVLLQGTTTGSASGTVAPAFGMLYAGREDGPFGPPLIGDSIGPRAPGIEATILQRMEDHFLSFQPVDDASLGILPSDPASACASMASIVGDVQAEVVVLAPAAPPAIGMGAATPPPVLANADDASAASPAPLVGAAGPAAVAAPDPAEAPDPAPGADPAVESPSSGEDPEPGGLPAPIGLGLRLTAPLLDATGWDEALGRLVEGVDDLLGGLEDLGGEPGYLPWIVAAGAAVTATEVARRARTRPGFAAAFVGGSAEAVDPLGAPRGRTRGAMLSDSVRRLLARGMSRWTTRR